MVTLFVYGTLRSPNGGPASDTHYHEQIAPWIRSAAPAHLPGARLYDLGSYPGIGSGVGRVIGEMFEVADSALGITDEIEGHPDFYTRTVETVTRGDGVTRLAWVYWAPEDLLVAGDVIATGDWFDRAHRPQQVSISEQLLVDRARLHRPGDVR